jgi:hypothetical protein
MGKNRLPRFNVVLPDFASLNLYLFYVRAVIPREHKIDKGSVTAQLAE